MAAALLTRYAVCRRLAPRSCPPSRWNARVLQPRFQSGATPSKQVMEPAPAPPMLAVQLSPPKQAADPSVGDFSSTLVEAPELNLAARATELGVSLSPWEVKALVEMTEGKGNERGALIVTRSKLKQLVRQRMETMTERQILVDAISTTHDNTPAQRVLLAFDFFGTMLFAIVATLIAGDAGMNIVGATLVGCVGSMGGGTVNNIMMGHTQGGVFWIKDPRFLYVTVAASIATFSLWPYLEHTIACREIGLESDAPIGLQQFETALERDPALAMRIRSSVRPRMGWRANACEPTAKELFEWADVDGDGMLQTFELGRLVKLEINAGLMYALETAAMSVLGVIGAQHGINRGLNPLVCVVSGVTICFGGIIRDLLCHRNIAIGSQSYALSIGLGAAVYVGLRQLVVRGWPIPLMYRIFIGAATTTGFRIAEWNYKPDSLLHPMANRVACS